MGVLDAARGYLEVGLSPIRVHADGSKAPIDTNWTAYADKRPEPADLSRWFSDRARVGVGIACGAASGNLAVLDFETWPAYEEWLAKLSPELLGATKLCPLARTGGGGAHLYVRLPEPVKGTVLAKRLVDGKVRTKIEFRGHGQQVLAPGCPAECHPSGKLYEWLRPGWTNGREDTDVTPWEVWYEWLDQAAAITEVKKEQSRPADTRDRREVSADEAGTDFNHRGTWEESGLFAAGWVWSVELGDDRGLVRRPDKKNGTSGSLGICTSKANGWPLFHCFTSSAAPFEADHNYDRFGILARLKHNGDFKAAARALAEAGYGKQRGPKCGPTWPPPPNGKHATPSPPNGKPAPPHEAASAVPPPPGLDRVGSGPGDPLPLLYYLEIAPALDTADFVEGLLVDGAMSVLYGDSNTGKTFFALDLALHIASGRPWRGHDVDAGGVLYLALEGSHGIRNRVAAFKLHHKCGEAEFPFAVVPVSIDLCNASVDAGRVVEAVRTAAERMGVPVKLVVVDTLSRAMAGGNENSPEDMGALVNHIDHIRQVAPAHVLAVHHSGKDSARGARGHSLLRAATDTEIEVSRDTLTGVSIARVTKQREMELGGTYGFTLHRVELGTNRRGKPVTSCVVCDADAPSRDPALSKDQQTALAILEELISDKGRVGFVGVPEAVPSVPEAWWRDAYYERGKAGSGAEAKKKAFQRATKALLDATRVAKQGDRVWVA